jgi:hypothetical protein
MPGLLPRPGELSEQDSMQIVTETATWLQREIHLRPQMPAGCARPLARLAYSAAGPELVLIRVIARVLRRVGVKGGLGDSHLCIGFSGAAEVTADHAGAF